ncbi:MAG: hypothetical protein NT009_01395 [Proteobacteria bacterium]|nr:hypothetical protein [Pseudomonadota bacterium]
MSLIDGGRELLPGTPRPGPINPKNAIESISPTFAVGLFCSLPIHLSLRWGDRRFSKAPDKSGNYEELGNSNCIFRDKERAGF